MTEEEYLATLSLYGEDEIRDVDLAVTLWLLYFPLKQSVDVTCEIENKWQIIVEAQVMHDAYGKLHDMWREQRALSSSQQEEVTQ